MGLLGDAIDIVVSPIDGIADTIESFTGEQDTTSDPPLSDSLSDAVGDAEDSVNDQAGQTSESVEQGLDTGTETVFSLSRDGLDAFEGLFRWFAGFGDTVRGVGQWIEQNGSLIPLAGDGIELVGALLSGLGNVIAGLFNGIAGAVAFIEGFVAFVGTLNGWESSAFLVGSLLVAIALYLVISGILSGEFIILPSYFDDLVIGGMALWFGGTLITWAVAPFLGSLVMAATGITTVFVALIADEGQLFFLGGPALLLGFPMVFTTLEFGFVTTFILTSASIFVIVYGTEYLEKYVVPRVSDDRSLVVSR